MSWRLSPHVRLQNDRIAPRDAERQTATAAEILRRFDEQPGVILADEVGMGKTFVALAVAYSVIEATGGQQPVVVKVPGGVREKWPRDWRFFASRCLHGGPEVRATRESHNNATSFLRLLDDPQERRHHLLFLTHTALTGSLTDPWVKLAIISRAFVRRGWLSKQRANFPRWAGRIVQSQHFADAALVEKLLHKSPLLWRELYRRHTGMLLDDDPVPSAILEALDEIRLDRLADELDKVPVKSSSAIEERLRAVRKAVRIALHEVWRVTLQQLNLSLPLLILDEAHHLKNPGTRLAETLLNPEDEADAGRGPLGGVFSRMLFLTATPFQLGHHELVQILRRFEGVRWPSAVKRKAYAERVEEVERTLSEAQTSALRLDRLWGRLRAEDQPTGVAIGWQLDAETLGLPERLAQALRQAHETASRVRQAEEVLRPWVIRHSRPDRETRRSYQPGRSILMETADRRGLEVSGGAVFPFLLVARVQAVIAATSRQATRGQLAYFAEGLASSYEAFLETRRRRLAEVQDDREENGGSGANLTEEVKWYLNHIEQALPDADRDRWSEHPKMRATVNRVAELWSQGEKAVVFCFYRATGRALRRHISRAIEGMILRQAASRLDLPVTESAAIKEELRRIGERFFDRDAPLARSARTEVEATLGKCRLSSSEVSNFTEVVLRFLRTPSFLVRYLDLKNEDLASTFEETYRTGRAGQVSLESQIERFGHFLSDRTEIERQELLAALQAIQTGDIFERSRDLDDPDEHEEYGPLLANVRLVNGATRQESRQHLMLAFNSPFFPEVLVASSVMAEGVDLHLNCRHVIHHDLDWSPSTLEQRTGRLDRLGNKAEMVGLPILIFEPYVEATQDEKQFLVVKDRERWFNVVMGQPMTLDEWATEMLAERLALPEEMARDLAMRLDLVRVPGRSRVAS